MTDSSDKQRVLPIRREVAKQFGGTRKFRAYHRRALNRAYQALNEALRASAYTPSYRKILPVLCDVKAMIEGARVKNWEGRK
jgi:hypothetical protein